MKKAFTLIELLIVIAIIAILALIAIPNFIQAQTRAKVSKVKADMRSLATAIEAYTVDFNTWPLGVNEMHAWDPRDMGLSGSDMWRKIMSDLTTPVAYISTIPKDPFREKAYYNRDRSTIGNESLFYYQYESTRLAQPQTGMNYIDYGQSLSPPQNLSHLVTTYEAGVHWFMFSVGPSRLWSPVKNMGIDWFATMRKSPSLPTSARYPDTIYDPTNGVTSYGFIWRSNLGELR